MIFQFLYLLFDRVNISVAIIPMVEQFGWSDTQRGLILSSFFVGYMVTQVMGVCLAAKLGDKAVLGFCVLWRPLGLRCLSSATSRVGLPTA